MPVDRAVRPRGSRVLAVGGGLLLSLGLAGMYAAWSVQDHESRTGRLYVIGPWAGSQLAATVTMASVVVLVVAVVMLVARARRSPNAGIRGASVLVVGIAVAVSLPFLAYGALNAVFIFGNQFTDLPSTRDGTQLVVRDVSLFHSDVTVFRRESNELIPLAGFLTRPTGVFAHGDYQLFDNGDSVTLVWRWPEDGEVRWDSILVPLDGDQGTPMQ